MVDSLQLRGGRGLSQNKIIP